MALDHPSRPCTRISQEDPRSTTNKALLRRHTVSNPSLAVSVVVYHLHWT